jgi:TPP-dependent trihydroxycyclohexane-1,2-dione (THcHDO) dehydratase
LLGFAIQVWTIPAQVVQIYIAISATEASGRVERRQARCASLSVAQATIRFLGNQYGERSKFFAGCLGIFGHGNVAGLGQALLQADVNAVESGIEPTLLRPGPQRAGRGARRGRLRARRIGCSPAPSAPASAPGSTNMLTSAALATIIRLPVLFAEDETANDVSRYQLATMTDYVAKYKK